MRLKIDRIATCDNRFLYSKVMTTIVGRYIVLKEAAVAFGPNLNLNKGSIPSLVANKRGKWHD